MNTIKFTDAQQAMDIHHYKNIREKLYKQMLQLVSKR